MDQIDQFPIGRLDPGALDSSGAPRRVSRLLLLWPLAGVAAIFCALIKYPPIDDAFIFWIGAVPCMIGVVLINVAWRKARAGAEVRSFFPRTIWLAVGCLLVPLVLLVNGVLDRSPVEQHREIVTRTILEHGRHKSVYYYLEVSSWRRNRPHEKVMVSYRKYLESNVGDPVILETRRGALGIPLLLSVHSPNSIP